jgi:hypothetical protein
MARPAAPIEEVAQAVLASTPVGQLLSNRPAVVLERLAYGGGATNWYRCRDDADLRRLIPMLHPGSCVSCYFDDRIRCGPASGVSETLQRHIDEDGDAFLGLPSGDDHLILRGVVVVSASDLAEELDGIESDALVFFGPFPARDNDGIDAITVTMPDLDGIVRGHPH